MDDAALVREVERVGGAAHIRDRRGGSSRSGAANRSGDALDVFHRDVGEAFVLAGFADLTMFGWLKRPGGLGLAQEAQLALVELGRLIVGESTALSATMRLIFGSRPR